MHVRNLYHICARERNILFLIKIYLNLALKLLELNMCVVNTSFPKVKMEFSPEIRCEVYLAVFVVNLHRFYLYLEQLLLPGTR